MVDLFGVILHVPGEPIPLILVDEPSIYRRYAIEAPERADIPWRQAYLWALRT